MKHRQSFRFIRGRHHGNSRFDNARLFKRNFFQRIAEPLLVVKLNIGDDAGQRRDNVRRIEPSAQAGFPNHQVAALFGKIFQRHHRDGFKKRRVMAVRKMCK